MKKRFNLPTVLALMLLMSVLTFLATRMVIQSEFREMLYSTEKMEESIALFTDARKAILDRFVGECDEETLNRGAVEGMMQALGDQWSYYMTPEQYAEQVSTDKSFVGIGVSVVNDDGVPLITEVYDGGPAASMGITIGSRVYSVEGVLVSELGYEKTVESIRGEEFTTVSIVIQTPEKELKPYNIMRRSVTRQMVLSEIIADGQIGYIRIHGFETRVDTDFEEAVRRLQEAQVKGLILDLRNNPGGSVNVMASMLDVLLPKGRLITLQNRAGVEEYLDSTASCVELPMVVLINEESYSAAEFFAACLSEYDWALTVGGKTTGKGYAQTDYKLVDGSGLHLSTKKYYTPKGVSLAGVGLEPDYPVALPEGLTVLSYTNHEEDTQYAKALELLSAQLTPPETADSPEPDSSDEPAPSSGS